MPELEESDLNRIVSRLKSAIRIRGNEKHGRRNLAIFLLMLDTGIRPGELCNLRIGDLNLAANVIVVGGKTGERMLPFGPTVRQALVGYLKKRKRIEKGDPLFAAKSDDHLNPAALRTAFKRLSGRAGIKLYPYLLRHTAATSYLRNGASLEAVRKLLGHSTYTITQRYLSLNINDLARAQSDFSPIRKLKIK